jgi:ABC-type sugar transport system substrate-binding protein
MSTSISLARGRAFSRLPGELPLAVPRDLLRRVWGQFVVVSFDTLPQQLQVLKDGYLTALIGQRPFEMGVQSIVSLRGATEGKKIENVDTGVEVVDWSNVDQFIKE